MFTLALGDAETGTCPYVSPLGVNQKARGSKSEPTPAAAHD